MTKVPEPLRGIVEERELRPESALAAALLESGQPARREVLCDKHHRLAAVYAYNGRDYLVVPSATMLAAELHTEVAADDASEVVLVAWSWDLAEHRENASHVVLRCRCGTWGTSPASVAEQLTRGSAILVSKSWRPDDRRFDTPDLA